VAKGAGNFNKKSLCVLMLFITLLTLPGLQYYYTHPQKQQWRDTAALIDSYTKPGDVIIIYPNYDQTPFDYYYKGNLPQFGMGETRDTAAFVDQIAAGKGRIWLVASPQGDIAAKTYLIEKYGEGSLILYQKFTGISVCLFELNNGNLLLNEIVSGTLSSYTLRVSR